MGENPGRPLRSAQAGTGGGFEKFCAGETHISNASRPIKEDEEVPLCEKERRHLQGGPGRQRRRRRRHEQGAQDRLHDGGAAQAALGQGLERRRTSRTLEPVPGPEVTLYGPGTDSGTFDFFTDEVNGEEGITRKDYQPSEDDNVLVQGVSATPAASATSASPTTSRTRTSSTSWVSTTATVRQAEPRDDPVRRVQAALAAAVHVPRATRR